MGAYVDAAEDSWVAGYLQDQAVLVLVVVDADPGAGLVCGAEDAGLAVDGSYQIESGVRLPGGGFAESKSVNFFDTGDMSEGDGGIGCCDGLRCVVEAVEGGEPEISAAAGCGVEVSAAEIATDAIFLEERHLIGCSGLGNIGKLSGEYRLDADFATPGVDEIHAFGFGKAAPGQSYPALYLVGTIHGLPGIFRSTDQARTWVRINDDQHQYGLVLQITGDPRIYGRVYVGTHGRGILYADPAR